MHVLLFAEHYWSAWTPFLLAMFVVVKLVVRRMPEHHQLSLRSAGMLVLLHIAATTVGALQSSLGYVPVIADLVSMAFLLLALVGLGITVVFRVALPRIGLSLPRILIDLVTAVGIVVVFIVVGKRAGFSVAGIITTSAVLTAVIGLALQDTLGNVMGGLSVQMDKSIQVGDWIALGRDQPVGRVTEIRWRYTAIETRNWETVIIPNGTIVKSQVMILGRRMGEPLQWRRQLDFYVDFRTPPTDVINAVESALRSDPVPRMSLQPPPHCLFFGVRDSFSHYIVRYFLNDLSTDDPTDSAVRVRVWYALRRAGIPLAIPANTIFLTHETPEREQRKQERELERRQRALACVDLFRDLGDAQRANLADELRYTPFAVGESVTQEGERDEGLYIIVEGEAIVRIGKGAEQREVARLHAGQFFGEMSLMTGEARTASVVAATNLECYRIDKPAFQRILQETPAIADSIAEVLATRRLALSAAREVGDDKGVRMQKAKQDLVGKIRGFFGLDAR